MPYLRSRLLSSERGRYYCHLLGTRTREMAPRVRRTGGETERHGRLKRLAFLWAQAQGYSACAMEVSLPKCRYRADVAAYRLAPKKIGTTAIFECKQALCDLRRDNCQSDAARARLETISRRRQLLEARLREH